MRYIRRKDDHNIIKSFGRVGPGGLGEFDESVYEEVEGCLPKKHELEEVNVEKPELSLEEILVQMKQLQAMIDALQNGAKQ